MSSISDTSKFIFQVVVAIDTVNSKLSALEQVVLETSEVDHVQAVLRSLSDIVKDNGEQLDIEADCETLRLALDQGRLRCRDFDRCTIIHVPEHWKGWGDGADQRRRMRPLEAWLQPSTRGAAMRSATVTVGGRGLDDQAECIKPEPE